METITNAAMYLVLSPLSASKGSPSCARKRRVQDLNPLTLVQLVTSTVSYLNC